MRGFASDQPASRHAAPYMGRICHPDELKRTRSVHVLMYYGTLVRMAPEKQDTPLVEVERVQTGVRLEKRMLKVLKAIAEQKDMTLGDLLEGIVLHAFEGKAPFSPQTLKEIE